jgi:hypothetical protein
MKFITTRSENNNPKKPEGTEAPVFAFGYAVARKAEEGHVLRSRRRRRKRQHKINTCLGIAFAKPDRMLNGKVVGGH